MEKTLKPILHWLVTLATPIILCTLIILVLLSPVFISFEYRRPGFPEDSYGFSMAERLEFGNQTRRYLVTRDSLDTLRQLEFENGDPIYKERELSHLEDVKVVIQGLLRVFYISLVVFTFGGYLAQRNKWQDEFLGAISRGGRLSAILLVTVLFFTLISFRALFTLFHRIFFEGDSWLFFFSDTLIRLFPMQLWQDVFLLFGVSTLAVGGFIGWGIPVLRRNLRKEKPESS